MWGLWALKLFAPALLLSEYVRIFNLLRNEPSKSRCTASVVAMTRQKKLLMNVYDVLEYFISEVSFTRDSLHS